MQWSSPAILGYLDVCSLVQECPDNSQVALVGGKHERCAPIRVTLIDVERPSRQQGHGALHVASQGAKVQLILWSSRPPHRRRGPRTFRPPREVCRALSQVQKKKITKAGGLSWPQEIGGEPQEIRIIGGGRSKLFFPGPGARQRYTPPRIFFLVRKDGRVSAMEYPPLARCAYRCL